MIKAVEIKAPNKVECPVGHLKVFLAGSIEMGSAIDWQKTLVEELNDREIAFLNPRREEWDSSWEQSIFNAQFRGQVEWELNAMEEADLIVLYLDPNTKSPISLLELGIHARSNKLIVCCPEGFYRKGNIDVTCNYYNIPQVNDLKELICEVRATSLMKSLLK